MSAARSVGQAALMLRLAVLTVARPVPTGPAPLHRVGKPDLWYSSGGRKHMKKILARRHGARCFYCHQAADLRALTFDHVMPRWLGKRCAWPGLHLLSNLALACEPCNARKLGGLPWALVWLVLATPEALEASRNAVAPTHLVNPAALAA